MSESQQRFPYQLVIFDVDGTLVETQSGQPFRIVPADWKFIGSSDDDLLGPRLAYLLALRHQGVRFTLATNQGGVACYPKRLPADEMEKHINAVGRVIGASATFYSFHHPRDPEAVHWRKPGPSMLDASMTVTQVLPKYTLMVGDRLEDLHAAQNAAGGAGIDFQWAWDFFGEPMPDDLDPMIAAHVTKGIVKPERVGA